MDYKLLYLNYDAEIHVHSNKLTYYYQYKKHFQIKHSNCTLYWKNGVKIIFTQKWQVK